MHQPSAACILLEGYSKNQMLLYAADKAGLLLILQDAGPTQGSQSIHLKPPYSKSVTSLFPVQHCKPVSIASQQGGPRNEKAFAVSPPSIPIPHANEDLAEVAADDEVVDADSLTAVCQQLPGLLADIDSSASLTQQVQQAEESWRAAASGVDRQTQDLVVVFEECVFPNNRYTRKRGDYHGSSLHLPGLIKAVSTEFNYKKYFSSKTAGGRKEYSVCLAIDTSLSMHGQLAQATVEAAVTIISALLQLDLDSFSILLFGETVRLVKTPEAPWNGAAIYTFLSQLEFEAEFATLDADAVQCALALLNASNVRGPKKVFVLTDGYGSCGARLAQVIYLWLLNVVAILQHYATGGSTKHEGSTAILLSSCRREVMLT